MSNVMDFLGTICLTITKMGLSICYQRATLHRKLLPHPVVKSASRFREALPSSSSPSSLVSPLLLSYSPQKWRRGSRGLHGRNNGRVAGRPTAGSAATQIYIYLCPCV